LQTLFTHTIREGRVALRQGVHPSPRRGSGEFSIAGGEFPRRVRIRTLFHQIVQQAEQRAVKADQVGGGDVFIVRQAGSRFDVDGVVVGVGETEHALVVPYYGLCFVGAELCYFGDGGGYAVVTGGKGDVAAAEERAAGDACGPQAHEGGIGAVGLGNVGEKRLEKEFEIIFECSAGIVGCVGWTVIVNWSCRGTNRFHYQERQGQKKGNVVGGAGEEHVAPKHRFAHNTRFWVGNYYKLL